jgi:hypothetical protein
MDKGFADLCLTTWLRRLFKDEGGRMKENWAAESPALILHSSAFILKSSGAGDGI